jgi:two-component system, chemotaxis family, chemotaxis protein CheY
VEKPNHSTYGNLCRVVIADDDVTSRCWLRGLLQRLGFSVVAEATNGQEAVTAVGWVKPDVVLLDVSMPVLTGPGSLPNILKLQPGVRVIMLSSIADEATVMDCIEKGAANYIRKDSPVEEICRILMELRAEIAARRSKGETNGKR